MRVHRGMIGLALAMAVVLSGGLAGLVACGAFSSTDEVVPPPDDAPGADAATPAEDVVAAEPTADAGSADEFAIACGSAVCDASTPVCCLVDRHNGTCSTLAMCVTGEPFVCDDRRDCEARGFAGTRCCGYPKRTAETYWGGSTCKPTCADDELELCDRVDPASCGGRVCEQVSQRYPFLDTCSP